MADNDLNKLSTDLTNALQKNLTKGLNTIGDILVKEAEKNIFNMVYNTYTPLKYNRSFDLLNGIRKTSVNKNSKDMSIDVFADDSVIQGHLFNDNSKPLEPYAEKVETGIGYDFDYPYEYNQPRPFMETTFEQNEETIANIIEDIIGQTLKSL